MEMFFWVIGAVIIVIIFLLVKAKYIRHKLFWVIIFLFIFLFYVSFVLSGISKNVDLKSFEGVQTAGKIYFAWLGNAFDNTKTIVGNAINMDWQINKTKSDDKSTTLKTTQTNQKSTK